MPPSIYDSIEGGGTMDWYCRIDSGPIADLGFPTPVLPGSGSQGMISVLSGFPVRDTPNLKVILQR
jgi:hypothetical protein